MNTPIGNNVLQYWNAKFASAFCVRWELTIWLHRLCWENLKSMRMGLGHKQRSQNLHKVAFCTGGKALWGESWACFLSWCWVLSWDWAVEGLSILGRAFTPKTLYRIGNSDWNPKSCLMNWAQHLFVAFVLYPTFLAFFFWSTKPDIWPPKAKVYTSLPPSPCYYGGGGG